MKLKKIDTGWIKLHRKFRHWKYEGKLRHEKVWQTLLFEANYDDQEYEGITIKRGELVFSYLSYEQKLKHCNPEITQRNLRTIIKNLESNKQIKVYFNKKKNFSIVKILNYEKYQGREEGKEESEELKILKQQLLKLSEENLRLMALIESIDAKKTDKRSDNPEVSQSTSQPPETDMPEKENRHTSKEDKEAQGELFDDDTQAKVTCQNQESDMPEVKSDMPIDPKVTSELTTLKEVKNFYKEIKKKNINIYNKKINEFTFDFAHKVIEYLNQKTGKNLRVNENKKKGHYKYIYEILNNDYSLKDFKHVIDVKVAEWVNTEQEKYLRPSTLFGSKFDDYLNETCSDDVKKQSNQQSFEYDPDNIFGVSQEAMEEQKEFERRMREQEADEREERQRKYREQRLKDIEKRYGKDFVKNYDKNKENLIIGDWPQKN